MSQKTKKIKGKNLENNEDNSKPVKRRKSEDITSDGLNNEIKTKFGPSVTFPHQRVWSRCALILSVLFIVWYNIKQGKEVYLARHKETLLSRSQTVECSADYKSVISKYPECEPERCGRIVTDTLVSSTDADYLLQSATNAFNLGSPDKSFNIFDLHSHKLYKGDDSIDINLLPQAQNIYNTTAFAFYKTVRIKIQHAIAHHLGVPAHRIFLAKPIVCLRLLSETDVLEEIMHASYWNHIARKETQTALHYASVTYLNDNGKDFVGGRTIFMDKNNVNSTVEPRKGRVTMFTLGTENRYTIENVKSGILYVLLIFFTCDPSAAVPDPLFGNQAR